MKRVVHIWFEKSDKSIRSSILRIGLNKVAARTRISPSMLSRWLRGRAGMAQAKVARLDELLRKESARAIDDLKASVRIV